MADDDDVPAGYIRGGDGQLYRKRIVAGAVTLAFAGGNDPGAAARAERVEAAMALAIKKAIEDGISVEAPEMRERIIAARNEAMQAE
jgi:hypothetical protein